MLIKQISGFEIAGVASPFHQAERTEASIVKRRLAFLELKDSPGERASIQSKLGNEAKALAEVIPTDGFLILSSADRLSEEVSAFDALCDTAKALCGVPQSKSRRFYSAEELFKKDKTEFERVVKSAGHSVWFEASVAN